MFKLIRQSVLSTLCLAVLLCAAYPMLVTGAADAFFPKEAAGSLILRDGAIVGSALIGQPFSSAKYFHPRPSAAGYNAGSSSGSNYGPTSKALAERVRASEQELRDYSRRFGMITLREDARRKVEEGITSIDEMPFTTIID